VVRARVPVQPDQCLPAPVGQWDFCARDRHQYDVFREGVEVSGPLGVPGGFGGFLTLACKHVPRATNEGASRAQRLPPPVLKGVSYRPPVILKITGWTLLGKLKSATQQADSHHSTCPKGGDPLHCVMQTRSRRDEGGSSSGQTEPQMTPDIIPSEERQLADVDPKALPTYAGNSIQKQHTEFICGAVMVFHLAPVNF